MAKKKIRPLEDQIVIEKIQENVTAGGIILPDNQKDKPRQGTVLAVGPGRVTEHGHLVVPTVEVGDKVVFADYSGIDIKIDGETFRMIGSKFVLGVVEEAEAPATV
jgi:chaperonin GroES